MAREGPCLATVPLMRRDRGTLAFSRCTPLHSGVVLASQILFTLGFAVADTPPHPASPPFDVVQLEGVEGG